MHYKRRWIDFKINYLLTRRVGTAKCSDREVSAARVGGVSGIKLNHQRQNMYLQIYTMTMPSNLPSNDKIYINK